MALLPSADLHSAPREHELARLSAGARQPTNDLFRNGEQMEGLDLNVDEPRRKRVDRFGAAQERVALGKAK